jgi:hypothetical protein
MKASLVRLVLRTIARSDSLGVTDDIHHLWVHGLNLAPNFFRRKAAG